MHEATLVVEVGADAEEHARHIADLALGEALTARSTLKGVLEELAAKTLERNV